LSSSTTLTHAFLLPSTSSSCPSKSRLYVASAALPGTSICKYIYDESYMWMHLYMPSLYVPLSFPFQKKVSFLSSNLIDPLYITSHIKGMKHRGDASLSPLLCPYPLKSIIPPSFCPPPAHPISPRTTLSLSHTQTTSHTNKTQPSH
jgi:hypothetical protein